MAAREDLKHLLESGVVERGYERQGPGPGIYTLPLVGDISGWVSLGIQRDGPILSVSPKVGVRHEGVHALVADLTSNPGWRETPTLSQYLGYLMAEQSANVVWEFGADDAGWEEQMTNLVEHVERVGRPWMKSFDSLDKILGGLGTYAMPPNLPLLRPACLLLLEGADEARSAIAGELEAVSARTDPAAGDYRRFAAALLAHADSAA